MKRLLVSILVLLMIATLFIGCGSGSAGDQAKKDEGKAVETKAQDEQKDASKEETKPVKKKRILFVNPLSSHPVYVKHEQGCKDAAKDYDVQLDVLGIPTTDGIVEKNVEALENAIAQKPDGIICVPFNKAMFPALDKAKEAGIPVVCTGNDTEDKSQRIAWIGTDNKTYGQTAAEIINKIKNGSANVCIMMSFLDISNQVEQKTAFEEKIKEFPGIKVKIVEADKADMPTAMAKFDEILRANKDIDTVWMLEATGGPAAAKVAKEQNKNITILDIDDVKETVDNVAAGVEYGTMAQNFLKMGYESVRVLAEYCDGQRDFPTMIDSGTILITKENAANYMDDMNKAIKKKGTPWK